MSIYRRPKQMKLKENLYALEGEFFYANGSPFEGYYHLMDLSNQKFFEGAVYKWKSKRIYRTQNVVYSDPQNVDYNAAKEAAQDITFETKNTEAPTAFTPIITNKEIKKGELSRFLVLKNNTEEVFEINEDQFKSYKKASNPYNLNFTVAKCTWFITGPIYSIYGPTNMPLQQGLYERNKIQANLILSDIPKMKPALENLLQYTTPNPDSNLYSDGSSLYLPDGQPYVGNFHVHPTKGPMAGAIHSQYNHPILKLIL